MSRLRIGSGFPWYGSCRSFSGGVGEEYVMACKKGSGW
jgi:hypothetical protein